MKIVFSVPLSYLCILCKLRIILNEILFPFHIKIKTPSREAPSGPKGPPESFCPDRFLFLFSESEETEKIKIFCKFIKLAISVSLNFL